MPRRPDDEYLTQEQAEALWRRAAQLQAESAEDAGARAALQPESAEGGIGLGDVEAAAAEAGIAPEFLLIARAEQRTTAGRPLEARGNRLATRVLGSGTRALHASRWFAAAPAEILEIMGRAYAAAPFHLTLTDMAGDDPAGGSLLVFDTPSYATHQTRFAMAMAYAHLKQVVVTVGAASEAGRSGSLVRVTGSLDHGRRINLAVGSLFIGAPAVAGGIGGIAAGFALGLPAVLMALPGLAALGAVGGGFGLLYRKAYRWALRTGKDGLEELLRALSLHLRGRGILGPTESGGSPAAPGA